MLGAARTRRCMPSFSSILVGFCHLGVVRRAAVFRLEKYLNNKSTFPDRTQTSSFFEIKSKLDFSFQIECFPISVNMGPECRKYFTFPPLKRIKTRLDTVSSCLRIQHVWPTDLTNNLFFYNKSRDKSLGITKPRDRDERDLGNHIFHGFVQDGTRKSRYFPKLSRDKFTRDRHIIFYTGRVWDSEHLHGTRLGGNKSL